MEIKIGEVKRAYVNKDGDISISNLVVRVILIDPTSMPPASFFGRWNVYTPYDVQELMEPGMVIKFYLGLEFRVPQGFVLYMFPNDEIEFKLKIDELFITPEDTGDVLITARCIESCFIRKYIHIANFTILPVLNTQESRKLMCASYINEYR